MSLLRKKNKLYDLGTINKYVNIQYMNALIKDV